MTIREFVDSRAEMEQILSEETFGFLGLAEGGMPYVVPLNYAYRDGRILFHCSLTGKKLDQLRANPEVCFSVGRQSGQVQRHVGGDPCHVDSESVICYGRARIIEELDERQMALNDFNHAFRPGAQEISRADASRCAVVEIQIAEMTGRRERHEDKERTYWRYRFQS